MPWWRRSPFRRTTTERNWHITHAPAWLRTPDAVRGDEVLALIVPNEKPVDEAALAREIAEFCLTRLAYYKAPGWTAFVTAIPLTGTQKIQRGALKQLAHDCMEQGRCHDTRALKKRSA